MFRVVMEQTIRFFTFLIQTQWCKLQNIEESLPPIYSQKYYLMREKNTEMQCLWSKIITSVSQFWKSLLMPVIQIYIILLKELMSILNNMKPNSVSNSVPGFTTSQKTRPLIVAKLEEFIRNELITINSARTYQELKTFVWRHGRPEAQRSYNDDLVMSLAIATCWVRDTVLQENVRDLQYRRAVLNSMVVSNTKLNTTIPGMEGYKKVENFDKMKCS